MVPVSEAAPAVVHMFEHGDGADSAPGAEQGRADRPSSGEPALDGVALLLACLSRPAGRERLAEAAAALAESFASLPVEGLVDAVAAAERVGAWAKGVAAEAAAELATRDEMRPMFPARAGKVAEPCFAATELSLRLGVTRRSADRLVRTGASLRAERAQTGHALVCGHIDWPKARVLVDGLAETPLEVGIEVEAKVCCPRRGAGHRRSWPGTSSALCSRWTRRTPGRGTGALESVGTSGDPGSCPTGWHP